MNDMDKPIRHDESRLWLFLLGRGLVGGLAGLLLLSNPWADVRVVATIFAAYAAVDGVLAVVASRHLSQVSKHGRELVFVGVVDALAAIGAVVFPAFAPLRVIGGMRGLLAGLGDVLWSRRILSTELLAVGAMAAMGTGLLLLAWPGPATTGLAWFLAFAAMIPGALYVGGAMSEFRRMATTAEPHPA